MEYSKKSLARSSPAGFAWVASRGRWTPARHLRRLANELVKLTTGENRRLMVFMPPRHGKSSLCSHYFPAWFLGRYPDKRVILTSYGGRFAASWGRKVRDTLQEWGQPIFGVGVSRDTAAAHEWNLARHDGGMITAGVGGPITGRGGHLIVVDDPVKDAEQALSPVYRERAWEWWTGTARTRLEPGGSILVINTRWHTEDLAGKILAARGEGWRVLCLPAVALADDPLGRQPGEALWPERITLADLKETELDLGPTWWQAEYQQNPQPEGGTEWPLDWFGPDIWFDQWPSHLQLKVLALDPSKGASDKAGDYSAWVLVGKHESGQLFIKADLERRNIARIIADGVEHYRSARPLDGLVVETNQFQELLQTDFEAAMRAEGFTVATYGFANQVKKEVRIRRLTPLLSRGLVRFQAGCRGTKLLVEQLKQFPGADHDDGPDALEMAVRLIQKLEGKSKGGRDYAAERIRV